MTPALFGRDHPAGVLRAEIGRATDSHGGLVLVTGEAGIGKTTLVTDAAHEARRRGALVVGGSCWDSDSAPGYWPWVQVLRGVRRSATAAEWAAAQEASDGRLGILLGEPGGGSVAGLLTGTDREGPGPGPKSAAATAPGAGTNPGSGTGPGGASSGGTGPSAGTGPGGGTGPGAGTGPGGGTGTGTGGGTGGGTADSGTGPSDAAEAFGLYDAVTTALVTVSQSRPLLVVLDDLHSADPASLRLLGFAAQHAWFERLLLVGTYRDVEVEAPGHPLQPLILPLVSRASATLTLTGLGRDEVGALMAVTAGREPVPKLVDEVHRRTGGNPFFVEQTARLWHSGSPVSTIPPGVREAVGQRLALLPEPVVALLTTAAVLGRDFRRQVLAVVHGEPVPHVERLLERAVAARVVVAHPTGQYAFAHDLVRETLYASLDGTAVRGRHAQVVRTLDAHGGLGESVLPGDLARHAHLAGGALERERRIELMTAAAQDASGRLADEEAVGHYRRALDAATGDSAEGEAPDRRRTALICLDLAGQLRHGADPAEGQRYLDRAVTLAQELDEPELLARVAMTLHREGSLGSREASTVALLRDAHRKVTGKDGQEKLSPDRLAQELAINIVALARRGTDDEALAFSLWARHDSVWGLGSSVERLELTDEMIDVARRTHHREMELHATSMRWVALLELGDPGFVDQFRTFVTLAERADLPRFDLGIAVDTSLIASLHGRFAEAEAALADEAMNEQASEHAPFGFMAGHLHWALHLLRGRYENAEEVLAQLPAAGYPYPRLLEAITAVEQGDAAPALRHIAERSEPAAPYPRAFTPLWLRLMAQTAAVTGDPQLIARAEDALAPYAGQWVVSLYGCDISGPVDLWLGLLAAARGDRDAAVTSLTEAIASSDRLGARPWSVRARLHLAESLLARAGDATADTTAGPPDAEGTHRTEGTGGTEGTHGTAATGATAVDAAGDVAGDVARDVARAGRLLAEVSGEATELGLHHLASRAASMRSHRAGTSTASLPAPASGTATPTSRTPSDEHVSPQAGAARQVPPGDTTAPAGEFRRNGPVWMLRWHGVTVHVPDAKGLRDLHTLLGLPGADIPAVHLLAPEGGELVVAARQLGGDPVLDDEAKHRYKERLDRLDMEIDRAAARDDMQRVEEYDRERQALLDELRSAAGLGGRTRRLGDETERARKTVTARIRDTLRKLDGLHPQLAAHLRESVTTGTTCAYRPGHTPDWRL
ncbi:MULTISPECIES: AAA family ATPase [unclassified Streptomyces]|uniref:ATP-binding protein n=1 Tax=unclassified Streptomyces TaxID=2593676 RepID=UPI0009393452|nr:AAA family ATPase [Streptomyces sp. TSRI0281]OKI32904.1 ATPase [Streptomyces sp. TSRI0281]